MGRDGDGGAYYQMKLLISIHAPRVGRDLEKRLHATNKLLVFQSTRPVWGATKYVSIDINYKEISIHAPRVGRDVMTALTLPTSIISIHAPRVGRDLQGHIHSLRF